MKHRHSILLLADSECISKTRHRRWDDHPFFPGSRLKNYVELVHGFGFPFEILDVNTLQWHHLIAAGESRFSSVLFTCPLRRLHATRLAWLEQASRDHGISLIADAFLFSDATFFTPFGLEQCSGLSLAYHRIETPDQRCLYRPKPYPYSSAGWDIGVRPLLRFLLQSWFSRKVAFKGRISHCAVFRQQTPAVVACPFGKAMNYFMNFHPSLALKDGCPLHAALRDLLRANPHCPAVSIPLDQVACLRLDDPGSCERVHLEGYNPGVVSSQEWGKVMQIVRAHGAHLNLAYVPGWVDDGDVNKGSLHYQGQAVRHRTGGKSYHAWEVSYAKAGVPESHNYVAEYGALQHGVGEGRITILSHGLTHLTPDVQAWLRSQDKYTKKEWYREFRAMVTPASQTPSMVRDRMRQSVTWIQAAFGLTPRILVPSAHEQTPETVGFARDAGFKIFSSRTTFFLYRNTILANRKLGAVSSAGMADCIALLQAGYPIIFAFHDYDIFRYGSTWLQNLISSLEDLGVRRFISMEEFGVLLMATLEIVRKNFDLTVTFNFSEFPKTKNLTGNIPIRIGTAVTEVRVWGQIYPIKFEPTNNATLLAVPFSEIKNNTLHLTVKLPHESS